MVKINSDDAHAPYTMDDLLQIMRRLRAPDGCPWDREQDHASIRNNVLEEAYEVADGIDRADDDALCEELGDLLLQVVFHAQIAQEADSFSFADVTDGICRKLIHRHPHVFGSAVAENAEQVLDRWDRIKQAEKAQTTCTDTLRSVPAAFPALLRAAKVQKRAAKSGTDFAAADGLADRLRELCPPTDGQAGKDDLRAVGDLLFAAVCLSRARGVDAEEALQAATDRFITRFSAAEQAAGQPLPDCTAEQRDALWLQAGHAD